MIRKSSRAGSISILADANFDYVDARSGRRNKRLLVDSSCRTFAVDATHLLRQRRSIIVDKDVLSPEFFVY